MTYQALKINYNNKNFELPIWIGSKEVYFVDLTDDTKVPIEIVKESIEEQLGLEIKSYAQTGYKKYAKDHYEESNEFSYYFSCKDRD